MYSKSIKFADINYQIAQREEQVEIFTRYCEFLNYFEPSIHLQITIQNRHIDNEDFRVQMLLSTDSKEDGLDRYRREYNAMLSEKSMQGQNSIVREKFLTVAVQAVS